jgi:CRP-like cAMP-binding protein
LPAPLPYHVAYPTGSMPVVALAELPPGLHGELARFPEIAGIADAARQISASLISRQAPDVEDDVSGELETRRLPRITPDDLVKISGLPPLVKTDRIVVPRIPDLPELAEPPDVHDLPEPSDDEPTLLPPIDTLLDADVVDDETTRPRELPLRARPPSIAPPTTATGPLSGAFFVLVPPRNRASVLQRFRRRLAAAGTIVIEHGEIGHGLVIVVRGLLEIQARRSDGAVVVVGAIVPGDYVGEVSLLTRSPAPAGVVAAIDSEIMVLAESDFYEVTGAFPALWIELKGVAERRTREHAQRLHG